MKLRRQLEKLRKSTVVKTFHRTSIESQCFSSDHKVFTGQRGVLGRPLEQALPRHRRHSDCLPQIQQAENCPLQAAENSKPTLDEKPFSKLGPACIIRKFLLADSRLPQPCQLRLRGQLP